MTSGIIQKLIIRYTQLLCNLQFILQMPADLKELATSMASYERLILEIPEMEKTFPPITDRMHTLGK